MSSVSKSKAASVATVTTPVPLAIAKLPSSLPALMDQPLPSAESPVDAIVKTVVPSAASSAKLAELPVIEIPASVIVIVISSTYAVLVPSLTFTKIVSDWLVS